MPSIHRSQLNTCENMCTRILENAINSREDSSRFSRPIVRISEDHTFTHEYVLSLGVYIDGEKFIKKMFMSNIRDCNRLDELISLNIIYLISDLLNYKKEEIEFCTFSIDELDDYEIK